MRKIKIPRTKVKEIYKAQNEIVANNKYGYLYKYSLYFYCGYLARIYNLFKKQLTHYEDIKELKHEVFGNDWYPKLLALVKGHLKLADMLMVGETINFADNENIKANFQLAMRISRVNITEKVYPAVSDIKNKELLEHIRKMIDTMSIFRVLYSTIWCDKKDELNKLLDKSIIKRARTLATQTNNLYNQILKDFEG